MKAAEVFSSQSDNDQIEMRAFLSETLRTSPSFRRPQIKRPQSGSGR